MTQNQSLGESLQVLFNFFLADMNICCPGVVEKYDPETKFADVLPIFQRSYTDINGEKKTFNPPVIPDVRVIFPRGGGAFIKLPKLNRGDLVLLFFAQRSLDNYYQSDGKTQLDPEDTRMFDITDALAFPGLGTIKNDFTDPDEENLVIGNEDGSCEIHLTPDGKLQVKATRVNLADRDASKALALAEKVDQKFSDLSGKYNNHMTIVMGALVPILPTDAYINLGSTGSTKVFTNG